MRGTIKMNHKIIPNGNYKPAKKAGMFIQTAGMTPKVNGRLISSGKIPAVFSDDEYIPIVELAVKNVVSSAKKELTESERIKGVFSMTVYINAAEDFTEHSKIADIASDYLHRIFGDSGVGTRAAVGCSSLPGDAPVEIQITFII